MYSYEEILKADPEIAQAITDEMKRQNSHIELIASENWVSKAVMAAMGSPLTNKYAEGYPSKRYYGGCQCVDVVENLARDRAKELFGCDYVNVQPHSGAQANLAVYFAMLEPGDKILGMNLDHGGHLTHGSPVNLSGKYFKSTFYGVNDDGVIDYEVAVSYTHLGLIIIWLFFVVITLLYVTAFGREIYQVIQENAILNMLYENNPLMKLATNFM